jgi:hypothetical protein
MLDTACLVSEYYFDEAIVKDEPSEAHLMLHVPHVLTLKKLRVLTTDCLRASYYSGKRQGIFS